MNPLDNLPPVLLAWFDRHARDLPWRTARAGQRDPYTVWLSEIMLQQTTVAHAAPYYRKFLQLWPDIAALAAARDEDVMQAWAGLGYYARARNLLACARAISQAGSFPKTALELRKLPGIGEYTAGAIAALAFGERVVAIDGNGERIFARLLALNDAPRETKRRIRTVAAELVPADRPGDFAEALMDLGATVCTPRAPACDVCPLADGCAARASGDPEAYPQKIRKAALPVRYGHVWALFRDEWVLAERRPPSGLLGGMLALPTGDWQEGTRPDPQPVLPAEWQDCGEVHHTFTHFRLVLTVWSASAGAVTFPGAFWAGPEEVGGMPTVFRKALALAKADVSLPDWPR